MALAKGRRDLYLSIEDKNAYIPRRQAILFGAFISTVAISFATGYAFYISNPLAQEYFIRLTSIIY